MLTALWSAQGVAALLVAALLGVLIARRLDAARRAAAPSILVECVAPSYHELLNWLEAEGAYRQLAHLKLDIVARQSAEATGAEVEPQAAMRWIGVLTPAAGRAAVTVRGERVELEREIGDREFPGRMLRYEALRFHFPGRSRAEAQALFAEWRAAASEFARIKHTTWPEVYSLGQHGWSYAGRIRPRPAETVVTRDGAASRLIEDARAFLGREAWYIQRAVPWRRGYLLYGPSGTGKTSLIRAVATELNLSIAIIDLAMKDLDDSSLREALGDMPDRAVLVLEDIDAAFKGRERVEAAKGLTFSGVLNALDGLAAAEGLMVFMTTNHRESLDPALIRPGRADLHIELGLAGAGEAAVMFRRFFPEEETLAAHLAATLEGEAAPAAIQAALLSEAEDAAAAAQAVAASFAAR